MRGVVIMMIKLVLRDIYEYIWLIHEVAEKAGDKVRKRNAK